jgi:hypothetical protein
MNQQSSQQPELLTTSTLHTRADCSSQQPFHNGRGSVEPLPASASLCVTPSPYTYRVAVVQWTNRDEIAEAIVDSLHELSHTTQLFRFDAVVPKNIDVVFTYAPYGNFLNICRQLEHLPASQRPTFVHWNTEGIPDLRIPWPWMRAISDMRSGFGRLVDTHANWLPSTLGKELSQSLDMRMARFRFVGDYYYAYRMGLLHIFADCSAIYGQLHRQHGLPTLYLPWGASRNWYADLNLTRDIDVLWMGKRATKRRSQLLDQLQAELRRHGVHIYMADSEDKPFIFREERTQFLNRAKITLNVTRTWYDDNFLRFAMAAPNRSLIVSEPMLPHCSEYQAGVHYISAPVEQITEKILYYLQHEAERQHIVENAYQLVTSQLTMTGGVKAVMDTVCRLRHAAD